MDKYSNYQIMVFSWNTQSVGLCETMDPNVARYNRTSYSEYVPGLTTWHYPCDIPDFYPKFKQLIKDKSPDLIVIGFQEDRFPGSYFHSHFLPEEMPKIGYELVKRTKLMGVGITTYKGALKGDLFERGLRISVYAKKNLASIIEKGEMEMRKVIGNDGQSEYVCSSLVTRGKGAIASYIMLPGYGRIAFICCHLPFNSDSLIMDRLYKNPMIRQNYLNESNLCFNNIVENLVLFKDPVPIHVIFFGDFNYRVADPRPATEVAFDFNNQSTNIEFINNIYIKYDELKEQMRRKNIYEFSEGINNQGPTFIPTCKMIKGRDMDASTNIILYKPLKFYPDYEIREIVPSIDISANWNTGSQNQRVPSWCDRILYNKFGNDGHNLTCTYYDRFDVGKVMAKSDHAGVIACFNLS
jgi:hypothetical protein